MQILTKVQQVIEQISYILVQDRKINIIKKLIMDKSIDKNLQLPSSNPLYSDVAWIAEKVDYSKLQYTQLQAENQRILTTLKLIESKLTNQLQQKKRSNLPKPPQTENMKMLEEKIKNNQKLINALKRDAEAADHRKVTINDGLESKTIQTKFALERTISKVKGQIKQLKLEEHENNKKLQANQDRPQSLDEDLRMQQELRAMSIKYVRLLDKYNKSTEKLALASKIQIPQFEIPEDIYDKQLEEREETQFKEYQGIVKLCTVLSHRNDSEHNKAHRQYTLKLKDLEKTIMKLGDLDQAITAREGELMESKKNIQLMKVKMGNQESIDNRAMRLSQGSIPSIPRAKSYSTAKLNFDKQKSMKESVQNAQIKLRDRGYSLSRIKLA